MFWQKVMKRDFPLFRRLNAEMSIISELRIVIGGEPRLEGDLSCSVPFLMFAVLTMLRNIDGAEINVNTSRRNSSETGLSAP